MGGCTFVDTRFPIFIFLTVFSFFFEVSAAVQVLRLSPSHSSSTGKSAGAYAFVHPFGSESGVFLLPLPLFPLSYWLKGGIYQ